MNKRLLIRDLTLRDGQQSSFATRMTQQQIERVLPDYKQANFYAMEIWGGAVPDSIMRYLNENPWRRLERIKEVVGDVSLLTALSRGRNLFGYAPYPDSIIEGFCRNSVDSGLGIMRIFDAINDEENVKSTIKYVKMYGGIADCAVCYTTDPHFTTAQKISAMFKGRHLPKKIFSNQYFLDKAMQMVDAGADIITIKDMSGLIPPTRAYELTTLLKSNISLPIDFHTHSTPGYGLASVVSAIVAGADIVDTNIWYFAGGTAAPAIELIYLFAQKMGIDIGVNMEAVAKINANLFEIRKQLAEYDGAKEFPKAFNPVTDSLPAHIDKEIDAAIEAAKRVDEKSLLRACHAIEDYFGFPKPNELVKTAQIPGGMYSNMVTQLKGLKSEDILVDAMKLIPDVRLDAGLPPLVTPSSQIVGAQAVSCAMAKKSGKEMYSNVSTQFKSLIKGEYGKTPIPIDPLFRLKITGSRQEVEYDTSKHKLQPNPILDDCGGVALAENEKEMLLLELFPAVAKEYLYGDKKQRYSASVKQSAQESKKSAESAPKAKKSGNCVTAPLPGRVTDIMVGVGERVIDGQTVLTLEAMKMENSITTPFTGTISRICVQKGENVAAEAVLIEVD